MSSKHDLPKGCQWPVKINAVVSDIKAFRPDLDVRATTFPLQSYRQKVRLQMKKDCIIAILECHYSPEGRAYPPSSDTPHVDIWVHAVEKELWANSQVQSEHIQRLVHEHLEFISLNNAWGTLWWLGINWLGKSKKIEFKSRIKGDWRNGETFTRLVNREP